ncbi:MAG TPA: hypothetical protein VFV58_30575 [Blastocatellia bacterium]|jgi:hypothetical protein|nr:hypothetical protein [Blastocatellia bacterium]
MYRAIDVWRRDGKHKLARYRCFQILESGKYCVQSVDYYYAPIEDEQIKQHEKQFLELLAESFPDDRGEVYDSLEEAIEAFDQEFK